MGDIADMMLDGMLCEGCGVPMGGDAPGHPRYCKSCRRHQKPVTPGSTKTQCPVCKKRVKLAGLTNHMRDAHTTKEPTDA